MDIGDWHHPLSSLWVSLFSWSEGVGVSGAEGLKWARVDFSRAEEIQGERGWLFIRAESFEGIIDLIPTLSFPFGSTRLFLLPLPTVEETISL